LQEIGDLREQLRDVMFFLEAQNTLSKTTDVSQEELQDGQVIVGAAASGESSAKKRSKKKR
jgi:BRCA1-associated protein